MNQESPTTESSAAANERGILCVEDVVSSPAPLNAEVADIFLTTRGIYYVPYAKPIVAELRANMVRVDADFSATPFKAKIANAEQLRVHTMLVIGGRGMEAGAVSVRLHHGGPQGAKPKGEVIADILAGIKERRA